MFCSIGKQVELLAEILECFSSVGKGLVETFLMLSNLAVDRQCSGYCNTGIRFFHCLNVCDDADKCAVWVVASVFH